LSVTGALAAREASRRGSAAPRLPIEGLQALAGIVVVAEFHHVGAEIVTGGTGADPGQTLPVEAGLAGPTTRVAAAAVLGIVGQIEALATAVGLTGLALHSASAPVLLFLFLPSVLLGVSLLCAELT
jgi:hypothetical protein